MCAEIFFFSFFFRFRLAGSDKTSQGRGALSSSTNPVERLGGGGGGLGGTPLSVTLPPRQGPLPPRGAAVAMPIMSPLSEPK